MDDNEMKLGDFKTSNGYYFLYSKVDIAKYFARKYQVGFPH